MSKNNEAQKKGPSGKQLGMLGFLVMIFAALLYVYFNMGEEDIGEETPIVLQPSQPIEIPTSVGAEANGTIGNTEQNQTNQPFIKEDIDRFFVSLLSSKKSQDGSAPVSPSLTPGQLPKLVSGGAGATVQLPELRNPNQLQKISSQSSTTMPIIASGMPTQLALPPVAPVYQTVSISGIACNSGVCRASSSAGPLTKGSVVGGGAYATEKIESITMSGVKTDKRFLSY